MPYVFPTAGMLDGLPATRAGRDARPGRRVVLRHDDAGRAGHLGGGPGGRRRRADGRRPRRRRRAASAYALVPAARAPRDPPRVRRVLLPQQRGGRGRGAARHGATTGWRSSTSTPTTATAPRRCSTTAADVFYGSLHVDPGAGWFPHFVGLRRRDRRAARAPAPRSTARSRRAPATTGGWPPSTTSLTARDRAPARRPSSCRSASTPPAPTRRARSR